MYHSCCSLTNANIQLSNEVCTARADLKFSHATIKEYANLRQLLNFPELLNLVWFRLIKQNCMKLHFMSLQPRYREKMKDSVSFTLYHTGNKYSESNLEGPVLKQKLRHVKFNVVWSHCRRQPFLNVILVSAPQWLGDWGISVYGIFSPVAEMKSSDSQSGVASKNQVFCYYCL